MELETQQQARQASGRRTQLKLGRDIKLPSVRKLPLVRRRALPVRVIGAESVPALSAALLLPAHPALVALALLVVARAFTAPLPDPGGEVEVDAGGHGEAEGLRHARQVQLVHVERVL